MGEVIIIIVAGCLFKRWGRANTLNTLLHIMKKTPPPRRRFSRLVSILNEDSGSELFRHPNYQFTSQRLCDACKGRSGSFTRLCAKRAGGDP